MVFTTSFFKDETSNLQETSILSEPFQIQTQVLSSSPYTTRSLCQLFPIGKAELNFIIESSESIIFGSFEPFFKLNSTCHIAIIAVPPFFNMFELIPHLCKLHFAFFDKNDV